MAPSDNGPTGRWPEPTSRLERLLQKAWVRWVEAEQRSAGTRESRRAAMKGRAAVWQLLKADGYLDRFLQARDGAAYLDLVRRTGVLLDMLDLTMPPWVKPPPFRPEDALDPALSDADQRQRLLAVEMTRQAYALSESLYSPEEEEEWLPEGTLAWEEVTSWIEGRVRAGGLPTRHLADAELIVPYSWEPRKHGSVRLPLNDGDLAVDYDFRFVSWVEPYHDGEPGQRRVVAINHQDLVLQSLWEEATTLAWFRHCTFEEAVIHILTGRIPGVPAMTTHLLPRPPFSVPRAQLTIDLTADMEEIIAEIKRLRGTYLLATLRQVPVRAREVALALWPRPEKSESWSQSLARWNARHGDATQGWGYATTSQFVRDHQRAWRLLRGAGVAEVTRPTDERPERPEQPAMPNTTTGGSK